MMVTKTCLLISDDPDDAIEFSEALNEISDNAVVITVSATDKAIHLLKMKKCLPDLVFIQFGMLSEFGADVFFKSLEADEHLQKIQVIAFGDPDPAVSSWPIDAFLNADMNYADFKEALRGIMGS